MVVSQLEKLLVTAYNLCAITEPSGAISEYSIPQLLCNDGTILSIQFKTGCSAITYPRRILDFAHKFTEVSKIKSVEIQVKSKSPLKNEYLGIYYSYSNNVYLFVPIELLCIVINECNGFKGLNLEEPFWKNLKQNPHTNKTVYQPLYELSAHYRENK